MLGMLDEDEGGGTHGNQHPVLRFDLARSHRRLSASVADLTRRDQGFPGKTGPDEVDVELSGDDVMVNRTGTVGGHAHDRVEQGRNDPAMRDAERPEMFGANLEHKLGRVAGLGPQSLQKM